MDYVKTIRSYHSWAMVQAVMVRATRELELVFQLASSLFVVLVVAGKIEMRF